MKIPTMKHISLRRLQTYIHCTNNINSYGFRALNVLLFLCLPSSDLVFENLVIVALEHNMIEAEVILNDFQKVMAVILSIILQVKENISSIFSASYPIYLILA